MSVYTPFPSFEEWSAHSEGHATFDLYAARFRALADQEREAAREHLTRSAAVDTNAIEGVYHSDRGFTRTVAEQAYGWEAQMDSRGPQVRPAFDNALDGYQYILDVATGRVELSEMLIRELHATMTASQETFVVITTVGQQEQQLPHGEYKTMPNSPTRKDGTTHAYASVEDTAPEMSRLITECSTERFRRAHPVVQASYIHYAFVCVHPFADGNGRVSRALASIYLYRDPGIPFVVFQDQRNDYYDSLESADNGYFAPFMEFVAEKAIDAIMLAEQSSTAVLAAAEAIREFLADEQPASHNEFLPGALRLRDLALNSVRQHLEGLDQAAVFHLRALPGVNGPVAEKYGYSTPPGDSLTFYQFGKAAHNVVQAENYTVMVRDSVDIPGAEYLIASASSKYAAMPPSPELEVFRRELEPAVTEALRLRVDTWAKAVVDHFVIHLLHRYRASRSS